MFFEKDGVAGFRFHALTLRRRLLFSDALSQFLTIVGIVSGIIGTALSTVDLFSPYGTPSLSTLIIGELSIGFTLLLILNRRDAARKGMLLKGALRDDVATEDDFSFQLLCLNEAIVWSHQEPGVLDDIIDFFRDPIVIAADKAIRASANRGLDGQIDIYRYRQLIVNRLKELDKRNPGNYWRGVQVEAVQGLEDEYNDTLRLIDEMGLELAFA